jgi:hypothetical protein
MRLSTLLLASHRQLRQSRVAGPLLFWSLISMLSFYWPSQLLLNPWLQRLSAIDRFDWSLLRLSLAAASQNGLLLFLMAILLFRILLTPAIDAFVYGRLAQAKCRRPPIKDFYRLYLLEAMGLLLVCWLVYVYRDALFMLLQRPWRFLFYLLLVMACTYLGGLALSYYKARLASRSAGHEWPGLRLWLMTAVAQGMLTVLFGAVLGAMNYIAWRQRGTILLLILLLAGAVRTYGRIWKMSCAVWVWQVRE